jgi:hypothetical protein
MLVIILRLRGFEPDWYCRDISAKREERHGVSLSSWVLPADVCDEGAQATRTVLSQAFHGCRWWGVSVPCRVSLSCRSPWCPVPSCYQHGPMPSIGGQHQDIVEFMFIDLFVVACSWSVLASRRVWRHDEVGQYLAMISRLTTHDSRLTLLASPSWRTARRSCTARRGPRWR